MGKQEALIARYADELRAHCGMEPDMELLGKVTRGCGPLVYDPARSVIDTNDPAERQAVRRNFLVRKLGLAESAGLDDAIDAAVETYGAPGTRRHRPVLYYLLVRQLGREAAYP